MEEEEKHEAMDSEEKLGNQRVVSERASSSELKSFIPNGAENYNDECPKHQKNTCLQKSSVDCTSDDERKLDERHEAEQFQISNENKVAGARERHVSGSDSRYQDNDSSSSRGRCIDASISGNMEPSYYFNGRSNLLIANVDSEHSSPTGSRRNRGYSYELSGESGVKRGTFSHRGRNKSKYHSNQYCGKQRFQTNISCTGQESSNYFRFQEMRRPFIFPRTFDPPTMNGGGRSHSRLCGRRNVSDVRRRDDSFIHFQGKQDTSTPYGRAVSPDTFSNGHYKPTLHSIASNSMGHSGWKQHKPTVHARDLSSRGSPWRHENSEVYRGNSSPKRFRGRGYTVSSNRRPYPNYSCFGRQDSSTVSEGYFPPKIFRENEHTSLLADGNDRKNDGPNRYSEEHSGPALRRRDRFPFMSSQRREADEEHARNKRFPRSPETDQLWQSGFRRGAEKRKIEGQYPFAPKRRKGNEIKNVMKCTNGWDTNQKDIESLLQQLCNISLVDDTDFEDFYDKHMYNLDKVISHEDLQEDQVRSIMSLLKKFEHKSNVWLCKLIRQSDILNRREVIIILTTILTNGLREVTEMKDMLFLQSVKSVVSIVSNDRETVEKDISVCLKLLQSIIPKLQDTKISDALQRDLISIEVKFDENKNLEPIQPREGDDQTFTRELEDVRNWEILPTITDVRENKRPPLVPLGIKDPFKSDGHYLVTQFYLFLEDFIGPLRRGIQRFMSHTSNRNMKSNFKDDDVRVYKNISFIGSRCSSSGIIWDIQFDVRAFRNVRWGVCKFLQYGNLVCFTNEEFGHLEYAVISGRDPEKLGKGILSVSFLSGHTLSNDVPRLVMIETKSFYPVYQQPLSILKKTAHSILIENKKVAFSQQIVSYNRNIPEPKYLRDFKGHPVRANFSCLLRYGSQQIVSYNRNIPEPKYLRDFKGHPVRANASSNFSNVPILSTEDWPNAEKLGLNKSQYEGIKECLTRSIGIIQGPPGTGKTLIGLRIIEFLLCNFDRLNCGVRKPIVLISYTNHSLDQVLQAVLNMGSIRQHFCKNNPVVRIGSRSENESVQNCTLQSIRRRTNGWSQANTVFLDMKSVIYREQKITENIRKLKSSILDHRYLLKTGVMSRKFYDSLTTTPYKTDLPRYEPIMLEWLQVLIPRLKSERSHEQPENASPIFDDIDVNLYNEESSRRYLDTEDENDWNPVEEEKLSLHDTPRFAVAPEDLLPFKKSDLSTFWGQFNRGTRQAILDFICTKLQETDTMNDVDLDHINDLWSLPLEDRWRLYRYWMWQLKKEYVSKRNATLHEFNKLRRMYEQQRNREDIRILSLAKLVGMTTTGAMQHIDALKEIRPRILIVEEAAQVPEQHVLAVLSSNVEHLIQIGDHQQLRPSVNDYSLVEEYHTDISMMERLVRNGIPFKRLSEQHRMRPEISQLLTPEIYKNLHDHKSVKQYDHIKGMEQDIFFVDHEKFESQTEHSTSHRNEHEAQFLARLYVYLRQQGYSASRITIISPYLDQVRLLREIVKKHEILLDHELSTGESGGVRITAVDNFQGEENDIILLSMVRSNRQKSIGHLHDRNRICVCLSRAKKGFYAIGNFQMLKEKSKCWNRILSKTEEKGLLGKSLRLRCQNHNTITAVTNVRDFDQVVDGGCDVPCQTQLNCGHVCDMQCHVDDYIHLKACFKMCLKELCAQGHTCKKACFEPCGECRENVTKLINQCGHEVETECCIPEADLKCKERCDKILICGHRCQRRCGEECNTEENCKELVMVQGLCGHEFQVACCKKSNPVCTVPCDETLGCGHKCKGTCGKCSMGRLHIPCMEKCTRLLFCGHVCAKIHPCATSCPPCIKRCVFSCSHRGTKGCQFDCGRVCLGCRENCEWKCIDTCKNAYKCTKQCWENCDRPPCNEPCTKQLKCGHACVGLCSEKCPRLCRECHKEELCQIFFGNEDDEDARFIQLEDCPHVFEVTAFDKYMGLCQEENTDSDENQPSAIVLKSCPLCTKPIRRTLRYGNVVKKILRDLNEIKKITQRTVCPEKSISDLMHMKGDIDKKLESCTLKSMNELPELPGFMYLRNGNRAVLQTQLSLLLNVVNLFSVAYGKLSHNNSKKNEIRIQLQYFSRWIFTKRHAFSDFELQQFAKEIERYSLLLQSVVLDENIGRNQNQNLKEESELVQATIEKLRWPKVLKVAEESEIKAHLKQMKEKVPESGLGVSDHERDMIMHAMGFNQKGHWYKCKNGHIYAIGECGGAMEKSQCPECKTEIGGTCHRLRDDNSVATEMDGATHSAWSEQANLENYEDINW